MKPLILTYTGKEIDPLHLSPEDICIEDIAHALSMCNRFAGHTLRPISVAQHSIYVARLCDHDVNCASSDPTKLCDCGREAAPLQGLLHDASEAYLGDITKWLKAQPEYAPYRNAEDAVQRAVYRKFGLPEEMLPIVAWADKLMLRFEGEQGFGKPVWTKWLKNYTTYSLVLPEEGIKIGAWKPWPWKQSEEAFLVKYHTITR